MAAGQQQQQVAGLASGYGSTILTGPMGIPGNPSTSGGKSLTGQ